MNDSSVPSPLADILKTYCDVNAMDMVTVLRDRVASGQFPATKTKLLKTQLANAILNDALTPGQYKSLTGDNEYTTQTELRDWLRELWRTVFGDVPVSVG